MHNNILKFFNFLKNLVQFLKIITMFCVIFLILYWIQNLLNDQWNWLNFIKPLLVLFVDLGERISSGSINLFAAIFEFKYMIAVGFFALIYYVCNLLYKFTEFMEDAYSEGRATVKRIQENAFNKEMQDSLTREQLAIKKFQVYVETFPKKEVLVHANVNMDEQNHIMNKFLIEKTGVFPQNYGNGFLYSYENFNRIDFVLKYFFRLIKSKAPINYLISVNIIQNGEPINNELFNKLIDLKILNKISMLANVSYRYSYNSVRDYSTTQVGVYRLNDGEFEVFEFVEK